MGTSNQADKVLQSGVWGRSNLLAVTRNGAKCRDTPEIVWLALDSTGLEAETSLCRFHVTSSQVVTCDQEHFEPVFGVLEKMCPAHENTFSSEEK